jgi:hypothetical protein
MESEQIPDSVKERQLQEARAKWTRLVGRIIDENATHAECVEARNLHERIATLEEELGIRPSREREEEILREVTPRLDEALQNLARGFRQFLDRRMREGGL